MEKIISELQEFARQKDALLREKEELTKEKEELYNLFTQAQTNYNNLHGKYNHEKTSKLATIKKLEGIKDEQARAANIEFNRLQDEMSTMTSKSDYEMVVNELEASKEEVKKQSEKIKSLTKRLESRERAIIHSTMEGFDLEINFLNTQIEDKMESNVAAPPNVKNDSGAFAEGFTLPEPRNSPPDNKSVVSSATESSSQVTPAGMTSILKKVKTATPVTASKKQKVSHHCIRCDLSIDELFQVRLQGIEPNSSIHYKMLRNKQLCHCCFDKY